MVDYHVLGAVRVVDGGSEVGVGGPRQRRLLAMLLLHRNEVVSTDRLAEAVFAGDPTPAAATTLRSYVGRLRRLVENGADEPVLATRAPGYVLRVWPADTHGPGNIVLKDSTAPVGSVTPRRASSTGMRPSTNSARASADPRTTVSTSASSAVSHRPSAQESVVGDRPSGSRRIERVDGSTFGASEGNVTARRSAMTSLTSDGSPAAPVTAFSRSYRWTPYSTSSTNPAKDGGSEANGNGTTGSAGAATSACVPRATCSAADRNTRGN